MAGIVIKIISGVRQTDRQIDIQADRQKSRDGEETKDKKQKMTVDCDK